MAVYAKGIKFMASVGAGSTRIRKTFNTEAAALTWEASEEAIRGAAKASAEILAATPQGPPSWTLQRALDETHRHVWKGTGGETRAMLNAGQALAFFGPDTLCSAINPTWVREWMVELQDTHENCHETCNKKLSALSMLLKQAEAEGGLAVLPRLKRYKPGDNRIAWFSDEDEALMLKTCKHLGLFELHDFIVIGLDTGFRRSELLSLKLSDHYMGMLLLHAGATKSGKARSVPCRARVEAILAARKALGATKVFDMNGNALRRQWEDLRAVLGRTDDPKFIPHVLRHTCATRLVAARVPLNEVMAWMGHKVIATTMRYAHVMPGGLLSAMQSLESRETSRV